VSTTTTITNGDDDRQKDKGTNLVS